MHALLHDLIKELENYPVLQDFERGTGLRKLLVLLLCGPLFLLARLCLGARAANVICNLVGFAYPAIASIKAIKTKSKMDDTLWLTYFVVFASFTLLEQFFLDKLVIIFPFYYAFKFGWLIWAQAPSTNGAIFLYSHVVTPFIKIHSVVRPSRDPF